MERVARFYSSTKERFSLLTLRVCGAPDCLQQREARSAELGLSLYPTSDK